MDGNLKLFQVKADLASVSPPPDHFRQLGPTQFAQLLTSLEKDFHHWASKSFFHNDSARRISSFNSFRTELGEVL